MSDKRTVVEAWLSRLCLQLDRAVLSDHELELNEAYMRGTEYADGVINDNQI